MSEMKIGSAETRLADAVAAGQAAGKLALYFGCWERPGHYLYRARGAKVWDARNDMPGFPWSEGLLDGGLLKNGKHRDIYDGKVFWTCGGLSFWYAFFLVGQFYRPSRRVQFRSVCSGVWLARSTGGV